MSETKLRQGRKQTAGQPRTPVQARANNTRIRILQQARIAFAEKGFEAANTRDIAAAAGVSHPMIRYHFGNKDQLWREAVRAMFDTLASDMASLKLNDRSRAPEERYRDFIRAYIRYSAQHPEHARIMIAETLRGGERLDWMVDNFIRPSAEATGGLTDDLVDKGILPDGWHVSMRYIVFAACQMPFILAAEVKALFGEDMTKEEAIEAHTEAVLKVLLRDKT